jgi:hypothetical protein
VGGRKKTQAGMEIGGFLRSAQDLAGMYQSLNRVTMAEKLMAMSVLALTIKLNTRSRNGEHLSGSG